MLNINKQIENTAAVLNLEGRLDTVTAPELEKELVEIIPDLTELTFNLEKLDYVSSAGLRVFLYAQKTMLKQGEMKITGVNETIKDIFDVTGFSDILNIE